MKCCKKCLMPDTRPGITFENDICSPCINFENRNPQIGKVGWMNSNNYVINIKFKWQGL